MYVIVVVRAGPGPTPQPAAGKKARERVPSGLSLDGPAWAATQRIGFVLGLSRPAQAGRRTGRGGYEQGGQERGGDDASSSNLCVHVREVPGPPYVHRRGREKPHGILSIYSSQPIRRGGLPTPTKAETIVCLGWDCMAAEWPRRATWIREEWAVAAFPPLSS